MLSETLAGGVGPENLRRPIMLKIFFRTAILRPYEPHVIFRDRFPTRLASRQRSGVPDASSKELGHGKGASDQQDSSPFLALARAEERL